MKEAEQVVVLLEALPPAVGDMLGIAPGSRLMYRVEVHASYYQMNQGASPCRTLHGYLTGSLIDDWQAVEARMPHQTGPAAKQLCLVKQPQRSTRRWGALASRDQKQHPNRGLPQLRVVAQPVAAEARLRQR